MEAADALYGVSMARQRRLEGHLAAGSRREEAPRDRGRGLSAARPAAGVESTRRLAARQLRSSAVGVVGSPRSSARRAWSARAAVAGSSARRRERRASAASPRRRQRGRRARGGHRRLRGHRRRPRQRRLRGLRGLHRLRRTARLRRLHRLQRHHGRRRPDRRSRVSIRRAVARNLVTEDVEDVDAPSTTDFLGFDVGDRAAGTSSDARRPRRPVGARSPIGRAYGLDQAAHVDGVEASTSSARRPSASAG